jgi:hypothetical protein
MLNSPGSQEAAMRPFLTRGKLLIAACVIGVAVIAAIAIAAFLALRPSTTASDALLRGTYHGTITYAGKTIAQTITAKSDCAECDATITNDGISSVYTWAGDHWQSTGDTMCGPFISMMTATKVLDGFVQELTTRTTWSAPPAMCAGVDMGGAELVLTRTGD